MGFGSSFDIAVDKDYYDELIRDNSIVNHSQKIKGYSKTIGEIIHHHDKEIHPKNWMAQLAGKDRRESAQHEPERRRSSTRSAEAVV